MRFLASPLRALTIAGSILVLSLMSVDTAVAAPHRASGPLCDAQTPAARRLLRHPRSFGGPVKRPSVHALAGLQDVSVRLRRGTHTVLPETIALIQNDSSATVSGAGDHLIQSLLPLDIIRSVDPQPRSRAFSPRSPRGPPLSA
jgi:hypothetical protein